MNSSESPIMSIASSVLACTTSAFESGDLSAAFSTTRTATPRRASSPAAMRPVGPAPTASTFVWLSLVLGPFNSFSACLNRWSVGAEERVELTKRRCRLGHAALGEKPHDVTDLLRARPAFARQANMEPERVSQGLLGDIGRQREVRTFPRAQPWHRPRSIYPGRDEV